MPRQSQPANRLFLCSNWEYADHYHLIIYINKAICWPHVWYNEHNLHRYFVIFGVPIKFIFWVGGQPAKWYAYSWLERRNNQPTSPDRHHRIWLRTHTSPRQIMRTWLGLMMYNYIKTLWKYFRIILCLKIGHNSEVKILIPHELVVVFHRARDNALRHKIILMYFHQIL